jgi:hypothetical protein
MSSPPPQLPNFFVKDQPLTLPNMLEVIYDSALMDAAMMLLPCEDDIMPRIDGAGLRCIN